MTLFDSFVAGFVVGFGACVTVTLVILRRVLCWNGSERRKPQ